MKQSTYNSLKSFIWGIANDCLVDVYDVGDYRKIILPMFVIRRFDAVLEPTHDAVVEAKKKFEATGKATDFDPALMSIAGQAFVNKSDFTLTDLKSRTNQQQLKKDFINYLDGFSANVQEINNKFHIRAEIDRFVHQKKKQIKKLEELRRKKIDEIVTFGLDKKVNTKLTKAKWMGEVPTYWTEYRLKNLFREINVRSEQGLEPHLSMSQKKGLVTDDEDIERRLLSESYAGAKICEKDDLVLNRLKAHLGVFALSPIKGIVSPDYTVLRLNDNVIPKYLEYLLKSNACRGELTVRVRGIVEGFWRLYTEDLGAIPICIPSIEEQKDILNEIVVIDRRVDKLIKAVQEGLDLIMEYRTKIIADVVTGQIDVRNVVIPEYSRDEDTDSDDIEDDEEIEESED